MHPTFVSGTMQPAGGCMPRSREEGERRAACDLKFAEDRTYPSDN